jgi:hypothetical protein
MACASGVRLVINGRRPSVNAEVRRHRAHRNRAASRAAGARREARVLSAKRRGDLRKEPRRRRFRLEMTPSSPVRATPSTWSLVASADGRRVRLLLAALPTRMPPSWRARPSLRWFSRYRRLMPPEGDSMRITCRHCLGRRSSWPMCARRVREQAGHVEHRYGQGRPRRVLRSFSGVASGAAGDELAFPPRARRLGVGPKPFRT